MIAFIKGTLVESNILSAIIDVNGIGYEVAVPVTTAERLPRIGESVTLKTLAVYRKIVPLYMGSTLMLKKTYLN